MPDQPWVTKLLKIKPVAEDTVELHLQRPSGFNFLAGRFIQFLIPDADKVAKRSYSLSSHPQAPDIEVCLKLLPGGLASTYFTQVTGATSINFTGPQGKFICSVSSSPLYFVATGSGLGPIMSILTDELKNKSNTAAINLLFGVRSEADIFWLDRLDELTKLFSNFTYQLTLSQPGPLWSGLSGRVTLHLPGAAAGQYYFLCGSADMVKDARIILMARGSEANDIHFEIF